MSEREGNELPVVSRGAPDRSIGEPGLSPREELVDFVLLHRDQPIGQLPDVPVRRPVRGRARQDDAAAVMGNDGVDIDEVDFAVGGAEVGQISIAMHRIHLFESGHAADARAVGKLHVHRLDQLEPGERRCVRIPLVPPVLHGFYLRLLNLHLVRSEVIDLSPGAAPVGDDRHIDRALDVRNHCFEEHQVEVQSRQINIGIGRRRRHGSPSRQRRTHLIRRLRNRRRLCQHHARFKKERNCQTEKNSDLSHRAIVGADGYLPAGPQ